MFRFLVSPPRQEFFISSNRSKVTNMNQNELKKAVAQEAVKYVKPNSVLGVGTGSTVNCFIDALAPIKDQIKAAVSSSEATTARLKDLGIKVISLNDVDHLDIYIDGADEINENMEMIKGGGGALTREKIVASVSKQFICIVDESKVVKELGRFPLPIEVIPMAKESIFRKLKDLGFEPVHRDFTTDNGNCIIDVKGMNITNAREWEEKINNWVGVVTVGIFANRKADVLLIGTENGVKTVK